MNATLPERRARIGQKAEPTAAEKAAAQKKIDDEAAAKKAAEAADSGELSVDQVKTLVESAVAAAFTTHLPASMAKLVTADQIKGVVEEALKAHTKAIGTPEAKTLTVADVTTASQKAMSDLVDGMRRDKKGIFALGDASGAGGQVEIPTSWCKGNLPLHAKQMLNVLMKRPMNHGIEEPIIKAGAIKGNAEICKMISSGIMGKTFATTSTGAGAELLAVDLSSMLQRRLYLSSNLVAMMALNEFEMPSATYKFPLSTARPTWYANQSQGTTVTESDPTTAAITMTAQKLMAQTNFSYEEDEDSIIPVLPFIQDQLALSAAESLENAIINGDSANTGGGGQDSDHAANGATDIVSVWSGLRKLALAVSTLKTSLATGGITDANLRAMKKSLGKWGVNPADLLLICGVNGQTDLEGMPEVTTYMNYATDATIITGRLPKWRSIPIVTSAFVRENLNASGVYDGVTTTKGSIYLINRNYWLLGRRRDFTVETWRDVQKQIDVVVASFRRAFVPQETPATGITTVAIGYNYNS